MRQVLPMLPVSIICLNYDGFDSFNAFVPFDSLASCMHMQPYAVSIDVPGQGDGTPRRVWSTCSRANDKLLARFGSLFLRLDFFLSIANVSSVVLCIRLANLPLLVRRHSNRPWLTTPHL